MPRLLRDQNGNPLTTDYIFPSNTKIATDFTFDPSAKTISVKEVDFRNLVLVVNTTRSEVIFNPTAAPTGGTREDGSTKMVYDTTRMSASDQLLVLYESVDNSISNGFLLNCILEELQEQTKYLSKIYG